MLSIEAILASDDYHFVKANSGRDALKILLKDQDFNLVLMDVKMPGLSGFETASLIYEREKLRHIPVIFITAYNYSEERVYQGYKLGAVDYIYKPINAQLLKAKVAVFVDLYKKNHQLIMQEQKLIAINKNLAVEIKERKNSEEKVKSLNIRLLENIESLKDANAELARFAYVASHDLQEPLRKIQTYGDLLKNKYSRVLDENGRNYIERIQNGSARLQNLIKDILSYSRLTENADSFVRSDLNAILNEIVLDLEFKIQDSGAIIKIDRLPELVVSPRQIRQLFQNLLGNALKFSKKGVAPEIQIKYDITEVQDKSQLYCNIYVQDNGIGFDQDYAEQIFNLFKRLNDTSEFEGTGIGLAICKKIIEQHKGIISAKSVVNEGSVFTISLPVNSIGKKKSSIKKGLENTYS